jgi:glycosyltransferase involved in cell wall biosynthesis
MTSDLSGSSPLLSVIMPAHEAAGLLPDTLGALAASTLPRARWELIVVDDGSADQTSVIARRLADRVITLPPPARGPGGARNAGAGVASGEWLMFVDADVRVHADALERVVAVISSAPDLVAVFGTYDDAPTAPGLISEYRNLLHRYTHCMGAGDAATFWAGCGAVRREAFLRIGGFDTARFPRPQIEDIDLGYRLRDQGGRICLDPTIQGTHLKRWTLRGMLRTDLLDRGIPWMLLLLERRDGSAAVLNTGRIEQAKVVLAAFAALLTVAAVILLDPVLAAGSGVAWGLLIWSNLPLYRWFAKQRGLLFAMAVVPLHTAYHLSNAVAAATGIALHMLRRPAAAPSRA